MKDNQTLLNVCEVLSVDDPKGCDRIKVRLVPDDVKMTDIKEIPFVFPLLPKVFSSKPKVGESVLVLTAQIGNGDSQRYYIGPLIPQVQKMDDNYHKGRALSFMDKSPQNFLPSIYKDPNAEGIPPKEGDVGIIGRNNNDILLKDNDIQIRCGIRRENNRNESGLEFNDKNPAFIKIKHEDENSSSPHGKSSINIVADNVNILGMQSPEPVLNVDRNELINDEEFDKIMNEAHVLPYGDILIEFLKKFRSAFLHHTHPFPMLPPCMEAECLGVSNYNLDDMLSNSVRIS